MRLTTERERFLLENLRLRFRALDLIVATVGEDGYVDVFYSFMPVSRPVRLRVVDACADAFCETGNYARQAEP